MVIFAKEINYYFVLRRRFILAKTKESSLSCTCVSCGCLRASPVRQSALMVGQPTSDAGSAYSRHVWWSVWERWKREALHCRQPAPGPFGGYLSNWVAAQKIKGKTIWSVYLLLLYYTYTHSVKKRKSCKIDCKWHWNETWLSRWNKITCSLNAAYIITLFSSLFLSRYINYTEVSIKISFPLDCFCVKMPSSFIHCYDLVVRGARASLLTLTKGRMEADTGALYGQYFSVSAVLKSIFRQNNSIETNKKRTK